MIYFDNSATTLQKPPGVAEAVGNAITRLGNAGRSFYEPVVLANRTIYQARVQVAQLLGLDNPLQVAFTSSFTESLNLVVRALVSREDTVITTVCEHNSVLRPLYLSGCTLRFVDCDDRGVLRLDTLDEVHTPEVRYLFCTHGSNVTGNITDIEFLSRWCWERNITLILDIAQTFGSVPLAFDKADIFCFTGHKGLFGPQGTGGIITREGRTFAVVKTGGAGADSFAQLQPQEMPGVFEAGTLNAHGLAGLEQGVAFVNATGVDVISAQERQLAQQFYRGVSALDSVRVYGEFSAKDRLPIVSLTIDGYDAAEIAERLWEEHRIATRAGSHCAPLLHKRLGTEASGMVRFSFSYFNTKEEVAAALSALAALCSSRPSA